MTYMEDCLVYNPDTEGEETGPNTAKQMRAVGQAAQQLLGVDESELYMDAGLARGVGSVGIRAFYTEGGEPKSQRLEGGEYGLQGMPLDEWGDFLDDVGTENITDVKALETRHSGPGGLMGASWNFEHQERPLVVMFSPEPETQGIDAEEQPDRYVTMWRLLEPSETEEYEVEVDSFTNTLRGALGREPITKTETEVVSRSPRYNVSVGGEVFDKTASEAITDLNEELPDAYKLASET
jgi:hypothetical protein